MPRSTALERGRSGGNRAVPKEHVFEVDEKLHSKEAIKAHHSSLVIHTAAEAHSHMHELKNAISDFENSDKIKALESKLAKSEQNMKQAMQKAREFGIDVDATLGSRALKQVKAARKTHGEHFVPETHKESSHEHMLIRHPSDEKRERELSGKKKKAAWRRWQRELKSSEMAHQKMRESWDNENLNASTHYINAPDVYLNRLKKTKPKHYGTHKMYKDLNEDLLVAYFKDADPLISAVPRVTSADKLKNIAKKENKVTKQKTKFQQNQKKVLVGFGGGNSHPIGPEVDIFSSPRLDASTAFAQSAELLDDIYKRHWNLADCVCQLDARQHGLLFDGKPGKMLPKHVPHDDQVRKIKHAERHFRNEGRSKSSRRMYNKALMEYDRKLIDRDYDMVHKWQKQRRAHARDLKDDEITSIFSSAESALSSAAATAFTDITTTTPFRPTEFLIQARGLYEARDLDGNWHPCVITKPLSRGYHVVSIFTGKNGVTLTGRLVGKSHLRCVLPGGTTSSTVNTMNKNKNNNNKINKMTANTTTTTTTTAAAAPSSNMFEAVDSEGQYWDVNIHGRLGKQVHIDVLQDGQVVAKNMQVPETALHHKLLCGMTGLYEARDSLGNWHHVNVVSRVYPQRTGGWYQIDVLHGGELTRDATAPRSHIRLRPGVRFYATSQGLLRGFPNLLPGEAKLYSSSAAANNKNNNNAITKDKDFHMMPDMSPRKKTKISKLNEVKYNTEAPWMGFSPQARYSFEFPSDIGDLISSISRSRSPTVRSDSTAPGSRFTPVSSVAMGAGRGGGAGVKNLGDDLLLNNNNNKTGGSKGLKNNRSNNNNKPGKLGAIAEYKVEVTPTAGRKVATAAAADKVKDTQNKWLAKKPITTAAPRPMSRGSDAPNDNNNNNSSSAQISRQTSPSAQTPTTTTSTAGSRGAAVPSAVVMLHNKGAEACLEALGEPPQRTVSGGERSAKSSTMKNPVNNNKTKNKNNKNPKGNVNHNNNITARG